MSIRSMSFLETSFRQSVSDELVVPVLGEGLHLLLIPSTDRLEYGFAFQIKKLADLAECIRMGAAHESVPNYANVKLLLFRSHPAPALFDYYAQP